MFELLSKSSAIAVDDIKPNTLLVKDLGIGGDDAIELLDALINEFKLDLRNFIVQPTATDR